MAEKSPKTAQSMATATGGGGGGDDVAAPLVPPPFDYVDDTSSSVFRRLCCPICELPFVDAVDLPCARRKHVFCRACVEQALRRDARCPTCRTSVDRASLHEFDHFNELLDELVVRCPNRASGCAWQAMRADAPAHVERSCEHTACPNAAAGCLWRGLTSAGVRHAADECVYTEISCAESGCTFRAPRRSLPAHVDDSCEFAAQRRLQARLAEQRRVEEAAAQERDRQARERAHECLRLVPSRSNVVQLNVGGVRMAASKHVLTKYPDSLLATIFSEHVAKDTDELGALFVDADGDTFRQLLNWLRVGVLPVGAAGGSAGGELASLRLLRATAQAFDLQPLVDAIDSVDQSLAVSPAELQHLLATHTHGSGAITVSLSARSLRGLNLSFLTFSESLFLRTDFRATNLEACAFNNCTFAHNDFRGALCGHAKFTGCSFQVTNVTQLPNDESISWRSNTLKGSTLSASNEDERAQLNASLQRLAITSFEDCCFEQYLPPADVLNTSSFRGASTLRNCALDQLDASICLSHFRIVSCSGLDHEQGGAQFSQCSFSDMTVRSHERELANKQCSFSRCTFVLQQNFHSSSSPTTFSECTIVCSDDKNADVRRCHFVDCTFERCTESSKWYECTFQSCRGLLGHFQSCTGHQS